MLGADASAKSAKMLPGLDEEVVLISCFTIGFVLFWALSLPYRLAKHISWSSKMRVGAAGAPEVAVKPATLASGVHGRLPLLPPEINAEIARCLSLRDLASLSECSTATWQHFGVAAEVWCIRTEQYGLSVVLFDDLNWREAFRHGYFRIDASFLQSLVVTVPDLGGTGFVTVLVEAARVVRGLMPRDGLEVVDRICRIAERALQAHNPSSKDATEAARELLRLVFHRRDVVDAEVAERLESAYSSALQLQAFIDVQEDTALEDDGIISWSSIDVDMESQRHCELDGLLEELRMQSEPTI
jgi:hypothetical protein